MWEQQSLRWTIYSFVDDSNLWRNKFSEVLTQMIWKFKYSTVVARFSMGAKLVVYDEGGCENCYRYGNGDVCDNHRGETPTYWLSYKKFSASSPFYHGEDFEEFEEERKAIIARDEEEMMIYMIAREEEEMRIYMIDERSFLAEYGT